MLLTVLLKYQVNYACKMKNGQKKDNKKPQDFEIVAVFSSAWLLCGGDGGIWTRVQKALPLGTTCLVALYVDH